MDSKRTSLPHDASADVDMKDAHEFRDGTSSTTAVDLLSAEHTDGVLEAKMRLVNNAIDEIGFTNHHWKLFWCVVDKKNLEK